MLIFFSILQYMHGPFMAIYKKIYIAVYVCVFFFVRVCMRVCVCVVCVRAYACV